MATQDYTVVFVPGAWHSPDGYDAVIAHLNKHGYQTAKAWTPSVVRKDAEPVKNFDPDVAEVRKHVKAATDAGHKVIVVMHSYGGVPGSQAVEGFDQATMATQGHKDGRGVVHMVYLAAFMPRIGESLASISGPPPDWQELREGGVTFPKTPAHTFYNDFESQVDIDHWIAQLNPHSRTVALSTVTHSPWKIMPTTYLACEKDNAIPIEVQCQMVKHAIDAGAIDMRVLRWPGGHTPQGARPLDVSRIIRAAAGDVDGPKL